MAILETAICAMVLATCPCETQPSGFAGGAGTVNDPYLICSVDQLELVADNLNAHYRLTADIDMAGVAWTPIAFGTFSDASLLFNGTFDGDGFSISNLTAGSLTQDVTGFFGRIGPTGVVRDLHMRNVSIQGKLCAGGLASENRGLIERCSTTGAVTGQTFIGGMIGDNRARLENCYSQCTVTGNGDVGGLIGVTFAASGTPTQVNCYSTGAVTGNTNVGGLCGRLLGPATFTACFWDMNTSGRTTSAGGTGRTTAQMKSQATFDPPWDFVSTWTIDEGVDYPRLFDAPTVQCCQGNLNQDSVVNVFDLFILLSDWGASDSPADLNTSGTVDVFDLFILLSAWGACPA